MSYSGAVGNVHLSIHDSVDYFALWLFEFSFLFSFILSFSAMYTSGALGLYSLIIVRLLMYTTFL